MRIKKRLEGLERAFEILVHQTQKEQIVHYSLNAV